MMERAIEMSAEAKQLAQLRETEARLIAEAQSHNIDELNKSIESTRIQIDQLRSEIAQLQDSTLALQSSNAIKEEENNTKKAIIREMEQFIAKKKRQLSAVRSIRAAVQAECSALDTRLQSIRNYSNTFH